jgi:hypothetical protein
MESHDIVIRKDFLATAINHYLSATHIQFNNMGNWNGRDFHVNDSYILLPGGRRIALDIPKSDQVKTVFRRYNGYVKHLQSSHIAVAMDGNKLRISVFFESAGNELKIGCINRRRDKPCKVHILKHTGDINNAQVHAWLEPVLSGSQISFKEPDVTFDFDLSLDSWILNRAKKIADWFRNTDSIIKRELTRRFKQGLKDQKTIEGMTTDLNKAITDGAINRLRPILGSKVTSFVKDNLRITNLRDSGENYVVTVSYPAPVVADSLDIRSFQVINPDATVTCPDKVTFEATIHTDYPMSGKVWLEHEDGSETEKLTWRNGKNQTTTSTISRVWNKDDLNTHEGWSRMVITFKDVFGDSHTKRSAKAIFKRRCSPLAGGGFFTFNEEDN